MTLAEVLESELGAEFIEAAQDLGREPAEVLAEVLANFIVVTYRDEPAVRDNPARAGATPARVPAQARLDAVGTGALGLWADRAESGLEIARRIRDANNRGT